MHRERSFHQRGENGAARASRRNKFHVTNAIYKLTGEIVLTDLPSRLVYENILTQ